MALVAELRALLGPDRVRAHPLELRLYDKDAGVTRGPAKAVALPDTTAEVQECVRIARRHGVPIVARGAGTGLAGGAVPVEPSLLIVTTRMNEIGEVDAAGRTAWVGAGVVNLDLSRHTAPHGLHFAPDPSSQSASTIGGNVACNAGGPHCLAEGTTVAHVLAMEMVTADGDVVVLGGAAPDPIGLDLRSVVVGSEGTFGIVTRILVKLTEDFPDVRTLLLGFPDMGKAAACVSGIIAAGIIPAALEMMDEGMVGAVENYLHAGLPTDAGAVLIAEVAGHPAGVAEEAAVVARLAEAEGATTVRIAADEAERDLWWRARKSAFGAIAQAAPDYYLHDIVVPRTRLVEVSDRVYGIAARYGLKMMNVYHAGDGNLHPLISFDAGEPGVLAMVHAAADEMMMAGIEAGGVLTGEHGVGLEKRDLMSKAFDPVDLDAQARLRAAFDPAGVLNPGKVLPSGSRCHDFDFATEDAS
jgi:glycolate oxidase